MPNVSRIRRDHANINLDTRFAFRNRHTTYNEHGEPEHTYTNFSRRGKRLSDKPGDGLEIDLDSGGGLREITGVRVLVRFDTIYKLGTDDTRTSITIDGQEQDLHDLEVLDRRRWIILEAEAST